MQTTSAARKVGRTFYVLTRTDRPDQSSRREALRPSHLSYLAGFADNILAAGAFYDPTVRQEVGSLYILDIESAAQAEAFASNDPFAQAGIFSEIAVRPWRISFGTLRDIIDEARGEETR